MNMIILNIILYQQATRHCQVRRWNSQLVGELGSAVGFSQRLASSRSLRYPNTARSWSRWSRQDGCPLGSHLAQLKLPVVEEDGTHV